MATKLNQPFSLRKHMLRALHSRQSVDLGRMDTPLAFLEMGWGQQSPAIWTNLPSYGEECGSFQGKNSGDGESFF